MRSLGVWVRRFALPAFVCVGSFMVMGPTGNIGGHFNSDAAIPVIMANDSVTPYHLFYYGQDRFGGWLFMIQSLLASVFGFTWTAPLIFASFLVIWGVSLGEFKHRTNSSIWMPVLLALIPLMLQPFRQSFFEINSTYLLQLALCLVICSMRCQRRYSYGVFLLLAFLAIWTSPSSAVILGAYLVVEAYLDKRLLTETFIVKMVAISIAALAFLGLRQYYYAYVERMFAYELAHHQFSVKSPLSFDVGDSLHHFIQSWTVLFKHLPDPVYPILGIASLLIIMTAFVLRRKLVRLIDEGWLHRAIAFTAAAFVTHILTASNEWVIVHGYHIRYFLPFFLLYFVSAATVVMAIGHALCQLTRFKHAVVCAFGVFILIGYGLSYDFTHLSRNLRDYRNMQQLAVKLADKLAVTPVYLFGPYWDVYKWQGLAPRRLVGLPYRTESTRIPWYHRELKEGQRVLVYKPEQHPVYYDDWQFRILESDLGGRWVPSRMERGAHASH